MKKFSLVFGIGALALGLMSAHAGVNVTSSRNLYTGKSVATATMNVNAWQTDQNEIGGPHTVAAQANVQFWDWANNRWEDGYGPVTMTVDPLLLSATVVGTIAGRSGPISINLTYRQTHVSSQPPYGDLEVFPGGPSGGYLSRGAQGRVSGTVTIGAFSQTMTFASEYGSLGAYDSVAVS